MPGPNDFLTMLTPDRLAMLQQPPGPSGLSKLLRTPGLNEGLIAGGLRLLASDKRRETFGQALYDAVPQGLAAYEEAKGNAEYNTFLNDPNIPEQTRAVLKLIGRREGAPLIAQSLMAGEADPMALGTNERLVNPSGRILVDAVPEAPTRDIRSVGGNLVEILPKGVDTLYTAPETDTTPAAESTLRREFDGNTGKFTAAANAFRQLEAAASGEGTPAKDISLVFQYMKTMDPASTVREGEFATAQNSGSAWDVVGNMYNRLLTGRRLNDSQRAEFLNAARELLASQLPAYQQVADQFRDIAEQQGLNVANVIRNPFTGLNLEPVPVAGDGPTDAEIYRRVRGR
jgi:hypothetical protein